MTMTRTVTPRNTGPSALFNPGRYVRLTILALLAVGIALPAAAQDAKEWKELKDTIKNEILRELRSEMGQSSKTSPNVQAMKDEIKEEILEALRKDQIASEEATVQVREELKKELRQELMKDLRKTGPEPHPQAVQYAGGAFGNAQGQMLRRGTGLPACRVKLVELLGASSRFRGHTEGEAYETVTDRNGRFSFEGLPVGSYKIKWELPGDTGWIRRIRDEPDIRINAGQSSTMKAIETARPLLPR